MDKSTSTLGRVANVLGVASKHSKGSTPIETILKMQHFQLWGFILMILAVACIIWLIQKKLDSIDKQYKEQFIILHRLFKSHQDLQVKVHKSNGNNVVVQQTEEKKNVTNNEPNAFIPEPIVNIVDPVVNVVVKEEEVKDDVVVIHEEQKVVEVDDSLPEMFD